MGLFKTSILQPTKTRGGRPPARGKPSDPAQRSHLIAVQLCCVVHSGEKNHTQQQLDHPI